jgi:lambda family phage portal protein
MIQFFKTRFSPKRAEKRSFSATSSSRLTMDWITASLSPDGELEGKLSTMRNRSRDLERNNEWVKGFLRSLENNTLGEKGISLQVRSKEASGKLDELANTKIETAWKQWGKVGSCEISGRHSWGDVQRLVLRSIARDGEVVIRLIRESSGLKLQVLEADLIDDSYNGRADNGNEIRFGVEFDQYRKPVAYYLLGNHPGDTLFNADFKRRVRVPAEEIIHPFRTERPDQTRGIPWLVSSMARLKMLDGYAEAELVAARTGAAKMGFFTKKTAEGWTGEIDDDGNLPVDAAPGTIEELPAGVDFTSWDSNHPNSGYGDFVKSCLRGVATSLGISYNSLSNDLEGVNYSSIRAGLIEEREVWKAIQRFMIEHVLERVFTAWLEIELLSGRLGLPFDKIWKFNVPEFRGRRWAWVDPKKDMEAAVIAMNNRISPLRDIIADGGGDVYEVLAKFKEDEDLAASLGISLTADDGGSGDAATASTFTEGDSGETQDSNEEAAAAGEIQSTGMNGAQIASLIKLAGEVGEGIIPLESAKAIAAAAFPLLTQEEIDKIFATSAKPKKPAEIDKAPKNDEPEENNG